MKRTGSPRVVGYATIAAVGLVGALALRRPELAVVAAPFALVLAIGLRAAREPVLSLEFSLAAERVLEQTDVDVSIQVAADRPVDRLELLIDLPQGVSVTGGSKAHALRSAPTTLAKFRDGALTRWGVSPRRIACRARDPLPS